MARSLARCCAAVVTAAALTFTVIAVASQREARADTVDVVSVSTNDTGTVQVDMGQDALWVQIDVLASRDPGAATLLTTDALTGSGTTWTTNDPVQLPAGTAYGDYPVDVDYRLDGGTVQHWSGVAHSTSGGQLDYHRHTSIVTTSEDRVSTDQDHRDVVLTGSVQTFDPAAGTTGPASTGTAVVATWDNDDSPLITSTARAVTDGTGAFRLTMTARGAIDDARVNLDSPSADTSPGPDVLLPYVPAVPTGARITGAPDHSRVHAGTRVTFAGSAQYLTTRGWQPLAHAVVVSALAPAPGVTGTYGHQIARGTTDASGRFSYTVTPGRTSEVDTFVLDTDYLSSRNIEATTLSVPTATRLSASYRFDMFAQASVSGGLTGNCDGQRVYLQESGNGRTGWSTIASATATRRTTSTCTYATKAYGPAAGYYRVTHPESDQLLAATTRAAHLARTPSRIIGFRLSPTRTSATGTVTARGTLQAARGRSWSGLRGGSLLLLYRQKGDSTWYYTAKGRTGTNGSFTLKSKAYGTGDWAVAYLADNTHLYSQTGIVHVTVH